MRHLYPTARYDLAWQFNSFDYYHWQAEAVAHGCNHVVFDCSAWKESIFPPEIILKRFDTIIRPGPQFLGLTSEVEYRDTGRGGFRHRYKLKDWVKYVKASGGPGSFQRMKTIKPPGEYEYTITLRNQGRKSEYRNSDRAVWLTFAEEIGAHVIEDYDDVPIDLADRMALYAGAKMNFGTCSGPMVFCTMSEYPCMSFDWGLGPQRQVLLLSGIKDGENMPWCRPHDQWTLWDHDTLPNIRAAFERWKKGSKW